jgi:hypothetical protein
LCYLPVDCWGELRFTSWGTGKPELGFIIILFDYYCGVIIIIIR